MAQQLQMPDELSSLIQDFIRPNPYKNKWDAAVADIKILGEHCRYGGKDSHAWGPWVNRFNDHDWDLMVSNCVAPAWLIEEEGEHINDEFLGMTRAEEMMEMLYIVNE